MLTLSGWYGRLGNNIQQCAIATLVAEKIGGRVRTPEHPIITPFEADFGSNPRAVASRFYAWNGHDADVDLAQAYIYENMRRICKTRIGPQLAVPKVDALPYNTVVIHIRSGDIFDRHHPGGHTYIPNPLFYYEALLKHFEEALIVTENDSLNPIVSELATRPNVTVQRGTVEEDFATLMAARNLASSGVGTFAVAAGLCSNQTQRFYCSDQALDEHLNFHMLVGTDIEVSVLALPGYAFENGWHNTPEEQSYLMRYRPS